MSRLSLPMCLSLIALLAACGGSSSDKVQSAISNMQSVIRTYNGTDSGDLANTQSACAKAYGDLGDSSAITTVKLSGKQRSEQAVLRSAYLLARKGFHDCALGSASLDFPRVMVGEQEIASANAAIARARRMER